MTRIEKTAQIAELIRQKALLENQVKNLSQEISELCSKVPEGTYETELGNLKVSQITRSSVSWSKLAKDNIPEKKLSGIIPAYSSESTYFQARFVK